MTLRPCLRCGRIVKGSTCDPCKRASPYQQPAWRALSRAVVQRDGACRECGSRRYLAAHHITPRAEGGPDRADNLETLCASCHARLEAEQRR
jgi:5-methylcytosine-specific restriction endonuclease McrA